MATAVENVAYRVSRYATLGDQWGTLWSKREKVVKSVLIDDLPLVPKSWVLRNPLLYLKSEASGKYMNGSVTLFQTFLMAEQLSTLD